MKYWEQPLVSSILVSFRLKRNPAIRATIERGKVTFHGRVDALTEEEAKEFRSILYSFALKR